MLIFFSLVTSVKDYIEIVHKLMESSYDFNLNSYYDFGAILTYLILCFKNFCFDLFSFNWLNNLWSLPVLIPNIASSIISEISILDGYFHNLFTFLENPISYGNNNLFFYCLEKFTIGFLNSLFLCLPTSTAHIITIRRFVIQGLEAGYISGLGTIAGNFLWLTSIIFGFRFIIIPWLSLDILRYILGFTLLIKYMWDSYNEKKIVTEDLSKYKIFLLTFLLAFTEQTSIFPFVSNLSLGGDSTILESFSTNNFSEFVIVHLSYLIGILIGSLSLLHFTCWFWENPAFKIYMWAISTFKMSTSTYYSYLNFFFLYLTMICTICSIPYYGLDYTITNPLGLVQEDRILEQKNFLEISFLNTKASDKNTRRNRGRHGRRERWKRRVRKYRTFDASLYDQGIYDLFTIEDLNYGFDRFWLRRKTRNHKAAYRLFPGPWMRSFKKQMSKQRLESFNGPRLEFFRMLFEQAYHPSFHERNVNKENSNGINIKNTLRNNKNLEDFSITNTQLDNTNLSLYINNTNKQPIKNYIDEYSALRKFIRKTNKKINKAKISLSLISENSLSGTNLTGIHSKRWKNIFSKLSHNGILKQNKTILSGLSQNILSENFKNNKLKESYISIMKNAGYITSLNDKENLNTSKHSVTNKLYSEKNFSKKDRQILNYRSFLLSNDVQNEYKQLTLFHPLKFYLQKTKAFQKKLNFYGAKIYRNFEIENNAPYFRVMMRRIFYNYKPTLRWERTMRVASARKARRKSSRIARRLNVDKNTKAFFELYNEQSLNNTKGSNFAYPDGAKNMDDRTNNENIYNKIQKPTHYYSLVSKRATRYRHQIFKDVLQHWYYSPFNRLLLKLDIDSFIRRQPFSHFLTKKEENLLHVRRFLLSEHYNTLRWYTLMEHYQTMKNKIGGTKSFATRVYNQQFQGTFKKIRHLFALTPSLTQTSNSDSGFKILKFDQVLYNEFPNKINNSLVENSFIHEELLNTNASPFNFASSNGETRKLEASDLVNQSKQVIKEYILQSIPVRQELMKKFLEEKNYAELTKFLWKGEKIRGILPITNEKNFLNQENNLLFSNSEQNKLKQKQLEKITNLIKNGTIQKNLWLTLIQESKNFLYNSKSLEIYLNKKTQLYNQRKKVKEKKLEKRIQRIQNWLINKTSEINQENLGKGNKFNLTTAIRKSIKESIKEIDDPSLNKNILSTKLLLKKENIENYLKDQLKSRKLVTIYALNNFNSSISEIDKLMHSTNLKDLLKSSNEGSTFALPQENSFFHPNAETTFINRIKYYVLKIKNLSTKPFGIIFKNLYTIPKKLIFEENENKDLTFWRKKQKANAKRNNQLTRQTQVKKLIDKKTKTKITPFNLEKNDFDLYNKKLSQRKKTDLNFENKWEQLETSIRKQSWNKIINEIKLNRTTITKKRLSGYSISTSRVGIGQRRKKRSIKSNFIETFKTYNPNELFSLSPTQITKRTIRGSKQTAWKKSRRNQSALISLKQKKRTHTSLGKLYRIAKKYKKLQTYNEIRKWWWQNFLPNFVSKTDALLESENKKLLKENMAVLLPTEILKRDSINYENYNENVPGEKMLQIGNKDYKPLSIPQAIRIRKQLFENNIFNINQIKNENSQSNQLQSSFEEKAGTSMLSKNKAQTSPSLAKASPVEYSNGVQDVVAKIYENTLIRKDLPSATSLGNSKLTFMTNPIPFYAGWDESLRKFVITNRLLSTNKAGYEMNFSDFNKNENFKTYPTLQKLKSTKLNFNQFPLEGLNVRKALYWTTPFSTYDQDQFFNIGMDGFAPIGWKRFKFKHSTRTVKPLLVTTKLITSSNLIQKDKQQKILYQIQTKLLSQTNRISYNRAQTLAFQAEENFKNSDKKIKRRTMKPYSRNKKQPNPKVDLSYRLPSGALMQQILPTHYLNVFTKTSRLKEDRYIIKRKFRSAKKSVPFSLKTINTNLNDLTFRRRIKPRRRYHRKNSRINKLNLMPKRRAFRINENSNFLTRPFSKLKNVSNIVSTKIKKQKIKVKNDPNNMRIRRLRRRIQRQVIKPIQRFKPKLGGFVWPGDYLRLELSKAPKLAIEKNTENVNELKKTIKKGSQKLKREIPLLSNLRLQPKKYLLQKHNLKVLKRRLQKAQTLNKLYEKANELNFVLNN